MGDVKWDSCRWGDITTLEYGKALRGYGDKTGPYPVYGTNGQIGSHNQYLCPHEGVIIGRKGAYRGVQYSDRPFFVIDTAFYLEPKIDMDMRWAYYALLTYNINDLDSGSAIPSTSRESFYALPVSLPPVHEQRAIAHVLGTLDDKIELNRRTNQTLEEMARALFKSWFVDFDPVRAKADGRQPEGIDAETAALFPDSFEDSPAGPIPMGWQLDVVGNHVINFDSKRIPVSRGERARRRGPYPYYGAAGVLDYVDDYIIDGIYTLVGEDGSVVNENGMAVTQYVWGKMWVNNHAHVLQGRNPVSTEQVFLFFQFEPVAPYVTGAVQPKLSQRRMNELPFVFPSHEICKAFSGSVWQFFSQYRAHVDEINTLCALRASLLPRLISGELRVPEAEREVEEAW